MKGPLLILDKKVNDKKFKDIEAKGNRGQLFKLEKSKDKNKFTKKPLSSIIDW